VTGTGFGLHARGFLGLCAAATLLMAAGASAQEVPVPAPPLPATAAVPAPPAPANNRGIVMPVEKSSDIQAHWNARRDYLRDRDERRAEDEEQHVRQMKDDLSIENLARLAAQCAADLGCDVVVGFSMGANIALEMAASGAFCGPLVLLAPSFSRADEAVFFRLLDRLARVLGHLPFAALLKMMGPAMKRMPLPPDRREVLAAEFRKNDPRVVRRGVHCYFQYLDRHGSVASRLCEAGVPAWVVHGERGDGGVTDDERRTLEACPRIRVITLSQE